MTGTRLSLPCPGIERYPVTRQWDLPVQDFRLVKVIGDPTWIPNETEPPERIEGLHLPVESTGRMHPTDSNSTGSLFPFTLVEIDLDFDQLSEDRRGWHLSPSTPR